MSSLKPLDDGTTFNLKALIAELRTLEPYTRTGHTARALIHTDDLRLVLVVMRRGAQMGDHDADATVTVQVLDGALKLQLPDREVEVATGRVLAMASGLRHDVEALADSAFLLTLGWTQPKGT